jgi:hypothetical protein
LNLEVKIALLEHELKRRREQIKKKDYDEGPYEVKEKANFKERWVYVIFPGMVWCRVDSIYVYIWNE